MRVLSKILVGLALLVIALVSSLIWLANYDELAAYKSLTAYSYKGTSYTRKWSSLPVLTSFEVVNISSNAEESIAANDLVNDLDTFLRRALQENYSRSDERGDLIIVIATGEGVLARDAAEKHFLDLRADAGNRDDVIPNLYGCDTHANLRDNLDPRGEPFASTILLSAVVEINATGNDPIKSRACAYRSLLAALGVRGVSPIAESSLLNPIFPSDEPSQFDLKILQTLYQDPTEAGEASSP